MFKSSSLFGRKKTGVGGGRTFTHFYNEWISTLSSSLLPQLHRVLSSVSASAALLSTHIDAIHHHFISYYDALDQAAATDVAQCLFPEWRNSLEKPFLWLGDLHPYLFTNLLRSFLDDQDSSQEDDGVKEDTNDDGRKEEEDLKKYLEGTWRMEKAWRSPSKALTARVDQIECGLRLMVPALGARAREAQAKVVKNVAGEWGCKQGVKRAVMEGMEGEMEELVGVVVDANRLRRSVLADVVSVTNLYQAASFLEALANFLIGFRDERLVKEFESYEKLINS